MFYKKKYKKEILNKAKPNNVCVGQTLGTPKTPEQLCKCLVGIMDNAARGKLV